jgi:hypothetical protein
MLMMTDQLHGVLGASTTTVRQESELVYLFAEEGVDLERLGGHH